MGRRVTKQFFKHRTTLQIARDLIGLVLVKEAEVGRLSGLIVETEAYTETDEASHSFGSRLTKRSAVMFKPSGHLYVYFTYGMHYLANIVTGPEGKGEAVLIRSLIPIDGIGAMKTNRGQASPTILTNGPAKLCQAFSIDKSFNGINLLAPTASVFLEFDSDEKNFSVKRTPRIGISKNKAVKWRFVAT